MRPFRTTSASVPTIQRMRDVEAAYGQESMSKKILTPQALDAELDKQPGKERLDYNGHILRIGELRDLRDCYRRWCKIALSSKEDREQQLNAGRILGLIVGCWTLRVGDHLKVTHEEIFPIPIELFKDKEVCEKIMGGFKDRLDGDSNERWAIFGRESLWNREILCMDFCVKIKRRMRSYRRQRAKLQQRRRSRRSKTDTARAAVAAQVPSTKKRLKKRA